MKILSAISFFVGFAIAVAAFLLRPAMVTIQDNSVVYAEPSIIAREISDKFTANTQAVILEKVKMDKPTAVVVLQDVVIDGEASTKYRLKKGATYKIIQANLNKANEPCVIEVATTKHEKVELKISKGDAEPINEGSWLHIREKNGDAEGWIRSKTQWY